MTIAVVDGSMVKPGIGRPSLTGGIVAVAARAVSASADGWALSKLTRPADARRSFREIREVNMVTSTRVVWVFRRRS